MALLRRNGIDPAGKRAVVIGRSTLVGQPMALMLQAANATVTIAHSRTADLAAHTREADILVVAAGRPEFIGAEHVRPGRRWWMWAFTARRKADCAGMFVRLKSSRSRLRFRPSPAVWDR